MPEEGTCPHHADFRSFLAEIEARLELQIARRKLRKTKNSPPLFGE
jgi:hypothetical protein